MKSSAHLLETPFTNPVLDLYNLVIDSRALKSNALGDNPRKHNYVLSPKSKKPVPLIVHLSGYFGNGPQNFNLKTLEENLPQQIIKATQEKRIPLATHVFVDAMTGVGGAQFIASDAAGDHETYLQKELVPAVEEQFKIAGSRCVMGASSGGYGALHHIALATSVFDVAIAIAPDSDFEKSLLPEFYKTAPYLAELSTVKAIQAALADGSLRKKKNFFDIMNTLAMTLCYSPLKKGTLQFPIDLKTGTLDEKTWKLWQSKDPVHFLAKAPLKNKFIYLEVGTFDEFSLYFGARKIRDSLVKNKVSHQYGEFPGGHFGSNERKMLALEWLKEYWS